MDIKEVYQNKVVEALSNLCLEAYKEGYAEGMKLGMEIKNSKCSAVEPFDYDEGEKKTIGTNTSSQEYKSEINKDLGILGE